MTEKNRAQDGSAAFEDALRDAFIAPVLPDVRAGHLQAMSQVTIEEVSTVVGARKRRRTVVRGMAAAAGLVLIGGSALAATGTLPDPLQNAVADAVEDVVDLPGGNQNASGGNPTNPTAAANKAEAEAYTNAKKAYNACKKAERNASPAPTASACGEKPSRQDFDTATDRTPKPDRTAKPEKTEKADRTPRPDHTPAADKTPRPDRTDKPARTERPVKTAKARPSPVVSPVA